MDKLTNFAKENAFELTVAVGSLYLALGRLRNLRYHQGCPRCETTQALVAFALTAWAGWEIWSNYGSK
ncbi:MAG: hypothetical protein K6T57_12260 [Thermaceae bacterium]|nr:hypothetical protein [Thermaceae bacterium]